MARIDLENISKVFSGGIVAVRELSLSVGENELLVLLGPSGCGKTTTLRLIAGLERPTSGDVRIGGRMANGLAPAKRDLAMVFQSQALYPHLSVYQNLAFGLRLREGVGRLREWFWRLVNPARAAEIARRRVELDGRVRETAERLGLAGLLERRPAELSGGQRQRVALGRAMVRRPAALLLDEPLSNLDAPLRTEMRCELKRLHGELGCSTIVVTHDQAEALTLGDRVAVMRDGRILQIGEPLAVYRRPKNSWVAGFIGSPPMNLIEGELIQEEKEGDKHEKPRFQANGFALRLPDRLAVLGRDPGRRGSGGNVGKIVLGVRPEAIYRVAASDVGANDEGALRLDVRVAMVASLGDTLLVQLEVLGKQATQATVRSAPVAHRLTAKWDARHLVAAGQVLQVAIDPEGLHLFDGRSGENLGLPESGVA